MSIQKPGLLVVAQDSHLRLALSIVFGSAGCRVRMAADGCAALAELKYEAPDILVSDLDMEGNGGYELLSIVGNLFPSIKVIAISSRFGGDHVPAGVRADAFHGKGANPHDLIELVRAMAGRIQTARTARFTAERKEKTPTRRTRRVELRRAPWARMALVS
jgi:DNA-binding NtrC family response regulator